MNFEEESTSSFAILTSNSTTTWSPFNDTTTTTASAGPPTGRKPLVNILLVILLTSIGVVNNTAALRVLWKCRAIRRSNHFVFIFNQSAADLLCCASVAMTNVLDYGIDTPLLTGGQRWWYCVFWRGLYVTSVGFFASSYNLATLSVDRTFSVRLPIAHRTMSRRGQKFVVAAIWIVASLVTLAVSLLGNGVDPESGRCVYRSKPSDRVAYRARTLFVTAVYNVVPFLVMSISYATLVSKLNDIDKDAGGVTPRKNNALKAILFVIAAYLAMYAPRFVVICFIYAGSPIDRQSYVYKLAAMLILLNVAVNPLIYTLRYSEFRRELCRQFRRLGSSRNSVGSSTASSSSNTANQRVSS